MTIFSFTEDSSEVFYTLPDTTICREANSFVYYTPDDIKELIAIPFVFVKINRPCKALLKKFASRHYNVCGYGIHLISNNIPEGSILDNSIYLSKVTEIQAHSEEFESFDSAIERASRYITLRTGDIIALELPPLVSLTIEPNTCQEFEYQDITVKVIG